MSKRSSGRNIGISLVGSALPALIGIAGTLLAIQSPSISDLQALFLAWSVIGFLALSDFGLVRTASSLATRTLDPRQALRSLVLPAAAIGSVGSTALLAILVILQAEMSILTLAALPLLSLLQMPMVGILESGGRFLTLATNRTLNAILGYLLPAVAVVYLEPGLGEYAAISLILTSRIFSLALLGLSVGKQVRTEARRSKVNFTERRMNRPMIAFWIGVSSLAGPLFLYGDRFFIAFIGVEERAGVAYVALSEMLIRTYVVPLALVSVLFPLMARRAAQGLLDFTPGILRLVPIVGALAVCVAFIIVMLLPVEIFGILGLDPSSLEQSFRLTAAILVSGTVLNWGVQFQVASLHALGKERAVSLSQLSLMIPFFAGMAIAVGIDQLVLVAAVWSLRIFSLSVVLHFVNLVALRRS